MRSRAARLSIFFMGVTDDFLEQYLRMKTANTQRSYRTIWRQWGAICADVAAPKITDCDRLLKTMQAKQSSDLTIKQRFEVLKGIYSFFCSLEICRTNPFIAARKLISWRQCKQVRPTKLIKGKNIMETIEKMQHWTGKEGKRDRAAFALMFGAGLRASEVVNLNMEDVQLTADGIPFLELRESKAGRRQKAPVPAWAWPFLSDLVSQRRLDSASNQSPLFCFYYQSGLARERLSYRTLARIYKRRLAVLGLEGMAPHSARASFATRLLEQGFEDRAVAEALRHSSTRQVAIYDKRSREVEGNVALKIEYK